MSIIFPKLAMSPKLIMIHPFKFENLIYLKVHHILYLKCILVKKRLGRHLKLFDTLRTNGQNVCITKSWPMASLTGKPCKGM